VVRRFSCLRSRALALSKVKEQLEGCERSSLYIWQNDSVVVFFGVSLFIEEVGDFFSIYGFLFLEGAPPHGAVHFSSAFSSLTQVSRDNFGNYPCLPGFFLSYTRNIRLFDGGKSLSGLFLSPRFSNPRTFRLHLFFLKGIWLCALPMRSARALSPDFSLSTRPPSFSP